MGTRKEVAPDNLQDAYKAVRDATVMNDALSHTEAVTVLQVILHEASADALQAIYKGAMAETNSGR